MLRHSQVSPFEFNPAQYRRYETLPEDFFRTLRARISRRGEVRLALAVLEDAVDCLDENLDAWKVPPRLFRWEAEQWIENRDRSSLFSFENVCSILRLDAEHLRWLIRRRGARRSGEERAQEPVRDRALDQPDSVLGFHDPLYFLC